MTISTERPRTRGREKALKPPLHTPWESYLYKHYPTLASVSGGNLGDTNLARAKHALEKLFPLPSLPQDNPGLTDALLRRIHEGKTALLVSYLGTTYRAKVRTLPAEDIAQQQMHANTLWPEWETGLPEHIAGTHPLSQQEKQQIPFWKEVRALRAASHPPRRTVAKKQEEAIGLFDPEYVYPATTDGKTLPSPFIDMLFATPELSTLMQSRDINFVVALRTLATMPENSPSLPRQQKTALLITHLAETYPKSFRAKFGIPEELTTWAYDVITSPETTTGFATWKHAFHEVIHHTGYNADRTRTITWLDVLVKNEVQRALRAQEEITFSRLAATIPPLLREHLTDVQLHKQLVQTLQYLPQKFSIVAHELKRVLREDEPPKKEMTKTPVRRRKKVTTEQESIPVPALT